MAEEYYLIKGETLTNLADTMRNVFGINEEFRGDQIATRIAGEVDNVYDSAFDDGYAEGYADGASSELNALYDVQVMTTTTGFYIYVYNYHPIYSLTIEVEVTEESSGDTDYVEFIVPPNGEDEYDSGTMGSYGSSVVWNINVYGVRWE